MDRKDIYKAIKQHYKAINVLTLELKKLDITYQHLTPEEIISAVCKYFGTTPEKVIVKKRTRDIVKIRHLIRYFLRSYTNLSLNEVSEITRSKEEIGNHSTVMHSLQCVNDWIDVDKELRAIVESLRLVINSMAVEKTERVQHLTFEELKAKFDSERGENYECPYNEETCNL